MQQEILMNIKRSRFVLALAWKGLSEQVSRKISLFGKTVKPDTLRKTLRESDVKRTCILEAFKIYLAATYSASRERGEIIFGDVAALRSLMIGTVFPVEDYEKRFYKANRRWIEILELFARRERQEFQKRLDCFVADLIGIANFAEA